MQQQDLPIEDQQVKRKRGRPKGSTNKNSRCVIKGGKISKSKPIMSLRSDIIRSNSSEHFLHLNLIRSANSDRMQPHRTVDPDDLLALGNCKSPFNSTIQTDQETLNKISLLSDLVSSLIEQFNEAQKRLDSIEAKLSEDKHDPEAEAKAECDSDETLVSLDANGELVLDVAEKLNDKNYIQWAKSIQSQLESVNLHIFLRFIPKQNERAINYDKLVKESILSTITPELTAKINLHTLPYAKQLWNSLRKLFYDDLKERIESNIAYLTRTDVKTIGNMEAHVENFRTAALELDAVDYGFNENVLIKLFLNSLSKELKLFHSMMKQQIRELDLDYERTLNHALQQSYYFARMIESKNSQDLQLETPNDWIVNDE